MATWTAMGLRAEIAARLEQRAPVRTAIQSLTVAGAESGRLLPHSGFPISRTWLHRAQPDALHRLARALNVHLCQCDAEPCRHALIEALARRLQ